MSLLEITGVLKRYGGNLAVDGVGFDLRAGELLALIGPNGAGKSTLFNMIAGTVRADAGSVRFAGREILGLPPRRIARLGVGRTFQIAATFSSLTVLQNVALALEVAARRRLSIWSPTYEKQHAAALELLDQVGMRDQAGRPCRELAYGDVKRVELAIALAGRPELLLMDEPTAGMAPAERQAMMAMVAGLVRERNLAVLFTEHSMDVVFAHADRVLVLARGRLIAQGPVAQVRADPAVQEAYFGRGRTFAAGRDASHGG